MPDATLRVVGWPQTKGLSLPVQTASTFSAQVLPEWEWRRCAKVGVGSSSPWHLSAARELMVSLDVCCRTQMSAWGHEVERPRPSEWARRCRGGCGR